MFDKFIYENLSFAYSKPKATGKIKNSISDFCVDENLGFTLTGEGEHLFLLIEKKQLNTEDVVEIIARKLNLKRASISYAGLKDKYGITTQWFSLHLPGKKDPDLDILHDDNIKIIKTTRHNKKLKIGALKSNTFKIVVKNFQYDANELDEKIKKIAQSGVPNYFGPQRFGNNASNLEAAWDLLINNKKIRNKKLRGLYISAARSYLFNQFLSYRVAENLWPNPVAGDFVMLSGTQSVFQIEKVDDEILTRIKENDITLALPLWGEDKTDLRDKAKEIELAALSELTAWQKALEHFGARKTYKRATLIPEDLSFADNTFTFTLPKGEYATTLLREIFL